MQETIVQRTLAILPMNGLPLPTFAAGKWKCIWGKESHPKADCWGLIEKHQGVWSVGGRGNKTSRFLNFRGRLLSL